MHLFEPNRHARSYPLAPMPAYAGAVARLKCLAEDAREQIFLADENLPNVRQSKRHMGHAGLIIGQLIADMKAIAKEPL